MQRQTKAAADAQGKATELSGQLDAERRLSARALAQVETLNQQIAALRRQLSALEQALDAGEKKDKDSQSRIADLGQRLNAALAQRVTAPPPGATPVSTGLFTIRNNTEAITRPR